MRLKLYAIHDAAVKEFLGPEPARTHGEAERKFRMNVNNPEMGNLNKFPEHYSLYCVGEYESETGMLEAYKEPMHLITAINCKGAN